MISKPRIGRVSGPCIALCTVFTLIAGGQAITAYARLSDDALGMFPNFAKWAVPSR